MPDWVDLHVHSNCSDGTDPPERVVERAARAGLAAIALTDHDTAAGIEEAVEAGHSLGVEVVPGIELSTDQAGAEVHLLGYFIRPDDVALSSRLTRFLDARRTRIEQIVARLNTLGLAVSLESVLSFAAGRSIGRPHVADALVAGGFVPSHEVAWRDYLVPGALAWVDRERIPLAEAVTLVRKAGGVASIAHPTLNLGLAGVEEAVLTGIVGLETTHPRVGPGEASALSSLCRRHRLVETGGSDCHGSRRGGPTMGNWRVPAERLDALRERTLG